MENMNRHPVPILLAALFAAIFLLIWLLRSETLREAPLGESCISLMAAVESSPWSFPDPVDPAPWAHLPVPPLSADEALRRFRIEEGFRIETVAHEPLVVDPVALDIDPDGRLWVIDMRAYNHDSRQMLETTGERTPEREVLLRGQMDQWPRSQVVILEDRSGDGLIDSKRIFYEGVLLPRSIKVLRDGILLGEPPNLWFIRDTNGDGRGDTKERLSSEYETPRSPQSGPSALLRGMDNWIHSSHFPSIRRVDGEWSFRPFEPLGQWELTIDDWGRLYSSSNSWPLHLHLVPHGYGERHPRFSPGEGLNVRIAPNGPVWPAHPTGVNRGYRTGEVTREDGTLKIGAGISSTVIYRGTQFGEEWRGDAFTPVAGGNLVKWIGIDSDPAEIDLEVRFGPDESEFLTSTDERFRPVNIMNAPDGTLYLIDMYRGLFDFVLWVTDYLGTYSLERGLEEPTGTFGRIYRIVREDRPVDYRTPRLSLMRPAEAARLLRDRNGALRDLAQQVLVECSPAGAIPEIERIVSDPEAEPYSRLQALWTLEGYERDAFGPERLRRIALGALYDPHPRVRAGALRILEPALASGDGRLVETLQRFADGEPSPYVRLQLVASLGESADPRALELTALLLDRDGDDGRFAEMAMSGADGRETALATLLVERHGWSSESGPIRAALLERLEEIAPAPESEGADWLTGEERALFLEGAHHYGICSACHGRNGEGVDGIGTPLAGSDRVVGPAESLVRIVLHGFEGGAEETGLQIPNDMPGHAFLPDDRLAAILTWIRNSWGNRAPAVRPEDAEQIRGLHEGRTTLWTPDELRQAESLNGQRP